VPSVACRRRKAALEALFARGKEDEAAEDAVLEQAKVIEAKRRAEASARRPAPVGAPLWLSGATLGHSSGLTCVTRKIPSACHALACVALLPGGC
jgi:hypothetical protein